MVASLDQNLYRSPRLTNIITKSGKTPSKKFIARIRPYIVLYSLIIMISQMMVQPSSWVESGIQLSAVRNLYLFKFTPELQCRLDQLTEKKKADMLSSIEEAELTGILELDRIFTLLNAKIIAQS